MTDIITSHKKRGREGGRGGGIYLMTASFIFMLSGYLVNIWLGRELGPADYGIYGIIISLMTAVNIIQTSGLPQSASRFTASGKYEPDDVLRASLKIQVISTLAISVIFLLAAPLLARMLNDMSLVPYIRATSLILPFYSIFALYTGYFNGQRDFKRQAVMNIIYSISKLVAVIGLVYVFHLYGAIAGFIVSPIAALLYGFKMPTGSRLDARANRGGEKPSDLSRQLIIFSLPLIGFAVLSTLQISIDLFFLKSLLADDSAAGLYTASQNIARIPYFALSAFALMLFPTISRSVSHDDMETTSGKIRRTMRHLLLLLAPATVLIAGTSSELISFLYTSEYVAAAESLSILVIGLAFLTLFTLLANVLNGAGRPGASMGIAGAGILASSVASWLLIPSYGLTGAAIATTIGAGLAMLIAFVIVYIKFPGSVKWASIGRIAVASLGTYLAGTYIGFSSIWLVLEYVILFAVYAVILLILRETTWDEVRDFKI